MQTPNAHKLSVGGWGSVSDGIQSADTRGLQVAETRLSLEIRSNWTKTFSITTNLHDFSLPSRWACCGWAFRHGAAFGLLLHGRGVQKLPLQY